MVISSLTQVGSYYQGHLYSYDTQEKTWTQDDAVWVYDPNGQTLETSTKYPAELLGVEDQINAVAYTTTLPAFTRTDDTLTMTSNGAIGPFDGITPATDDVILYNPGDGNTGAWVVTQGDSSNPTTLEFENAGPFVKVTTGTTYANTVWTWDGTDTYEQVTSPPAVLSRSVWGVTVAGDTDNLAEIMTLDMLHLW